MTESRRPILHLKLGAVTRPLGPEPLVKTPAASKPAFSGRPRGPAAPAAPVAVAPAHGWKCRPCGAAFDPPPEAADSDAVRCPSCNAKLGLAGDFRLGNLEKLRARQVKR